jgi:[ribosomal protein S5]-alanine N-acetyltransferase
VGLQTPRVRLEPRAARHAQDLFALLSDPSLYQFLDEAPPVSVEALAQRFARSESRRSPDGREHWLNWVVYAHPRNASSAEAAGRLEGQHAVGYVQATVDAATLEATLACVVGSKFWGQGHATDAVRQMVALVAESLGTQRFWWVAERANVASLALARRLGFAEVAANRFPQRPLTSTEVLMLNETA